VGDDAVTFTVNGKKYTVGCDIPVDTTVNSFLRDYCNLRGTKYMCYEGGCGACVVSVVSLNAFTKQEKRYAINSCLVPILACNGWAIETIEGIGNKKIGYHKLQMKLAHFNGTQCGYCSPGMIMNMYRRLDMRMRKEITMKEVENSFSGNICRCTGYRPILDAFKSVCIDASPGLKNKLQDIENPVESLDPVCQGKYKLCALQMSSSMQVLNCGAEWFRITKLKDIFDIFKQIGSAPYSLVAGNTAHGVYRVHIQPYVYIDIKDVPELISCTIGATLNIGGNMSLADTINLFDDLSKKNKNFNYMAKLADHIRLVANVPVRNIGTLAGNLMIKYHHNEFPSDLFLIFETVGATLNIVCAKGTIQNVKLLEFLDLDMNQKIIQSIEFPAVGEGVAIATYKVMKRAENTHALVNAGFYCNLLERSSGKIQSYPSIVFGGINPLFIHARKTEIYLNKKNLFDVKTVQGALTILQSELEPDSVLPDPSPEFRKNLACALFYKFVLSLNPPNLPKSFLSGGQNIERPLSSGKQIFQTDKQEWPLTKPMPKLEAVAQCSGEAMYVNDIPSIPGEKFAAFVLTTVGQGYIKNIDASEALKIPGVSKFLTIKDIPGRNNFIVIDDYLFFENEE
ncbi:hypothetical protein L9F63_019794, partial [Diploptera punctata]